MLLLTELTSMPDNKSTGIITCQKISDKVSPIPISILHMKSIANIYLNTGKVSPILSVAKYRNINNPVIWEGVPNLLSTCI